MKENRNTILLLCLETPSALPYSPAEYLAKGFLNREISTDLLCQVEVLPQDFSLAPQKAIEVVRERDPYLTLVLTNDLNNMELVLYRYIHNRIDTLLTDNSGNSPSKETIIDDGQEVHLCTTPTVQLVGDWQNGHPEGLSHITMSLGYQANLENSVAYHLLHEFKDKAFPIGQIGVPGFSEDHDFLRSETLDKTLAYLLARIHALVSKA